MKKRLFLFTMILLFALILSVVHPADAAASSPTFYVSSRNDFFRILTSQMIARKAQVVITYYGNVSDVNTEKSSVIQQLQNYISKNDFKSNSDDYDYLTFNLSSLAVRYVMRQGITEFTFTFQYLTSLDQEKQTNAAVKKVLDKLNVYGQSDYMKIKAVHDYLIRTIAYDTSFQNYTAYGAITKGSAVCQGYTLLTYKMLTELGVPCRIVTGTANGGSHAWNLVKLQGAWYNLDLTFDDPVPDSGKNGAISYQYFLKTDSQFSKNHKRDAEFRTAAFKKGCPMATKSFSKALDNGKASSKKKSTMLPVTRLSMDKSILKLASGGTFSLKAAISPSNASDQTVYYCSSDANVASISKAGILTANNAGTAYITAYSLGGAHAVCKITVS